jgi:hypothetical protein
MNKANVKAFMAGYYTDLNAQKDEDNESTDNDPRRAVRDRAREQHSDRSLIEDEWRATDRHE